MNSTLLIVLAIIFFINITNGLVCSYCDSGTACEWGLVFTTVTCNGVFGTQCYKISGRIGGEKIIRRGCSVVPFGKLTCKAIVESLNFGYNTDLDCYTCTSKECNSLGRAWSSVIFVALLVVALSIIVGCIYRFRRYRNNRNRPTFTRY